MYNGRRPKGIRYFFLYLFLEYLIHGMYHGVLRARGLFMEQDMKLKVYIFVVKEKIRCMCLQSCKMCKRDCELGEVTYNQYEHYKELFRQNKYGK